MTQPQPQVPPPEPGPEPQTLGLVALVALEAAFAVLVFKALAAWLEMAAAAVLEAFRSYGGAVDPGALWRLVPTWQRQVDGLMSELLGIARRGWQDTARQLGVDLPFDAGNPILQEQLQRTRNLLVRIPDEIYRTILRELDQAVNNGETAAQQAARVQKILSATGSENWPNRAQVIAVTEVHRAYNFGSLAAALNIDALDARVLLKRWDSKEDTRVRPGHREADGQTVPVTQPFLVALEPLMAPGDPAGSPDNVIHCRCKMRYSWSN